MEPILVTCTNCNGQGLVSTGSNPLDLKRGNTVVCTVCTGKGKVEEKTDAEQAAAVPVPVPPKTQDPSQDAPGGSGSSDEAAGAGAIGPEVGSRCLTTDGKPGTLGKNESGDWVCTPDPE